MFEGIKLKILILICCYSSSAFANHRAGIVERRVMSSPYPCMSLPEFLFCGEDSHFKTLERWLDPILKTEVGQRVFNEATSGRHKLLFIHSVQSVHTAGSTISDLTTKLSNGVGTDAVVQMHFDMPDQGTHMVTAIGSHDLIEFTADQNLFHELVHVKHTVNGTLATMQEVQAIIEENVYREQRAQLLGIKDFKLRNFRTSKRDQRFWYDDHPMF